MNALKLTPVCLSFLLLAAHFFRSGASVLTAACLMAAFLLLLRESWVVRLTQFLLALGALEWLRTLAAIAAVRIEMEEPWIRMTLIMGGVALFTALSALVFLDKSLKLRYGRIPDEGSG